MTLVFTRKLRLKFFGIFFFLLTLENHSSVPYDTYNPLNFLYTQCFMICVLICVWKLCSCVVLFHVEGRVCLVMRSTRFYRKLGSYWFCIFGKRLLHIIKKNSTLCHRVSFVPKTLRYKNYALNALILYNNHFLLLEYYFSCRLECWLTRMF